VISGRNKPSFDFLQKTLKAFPGLNASWLLLGEGTMYEQMGRNVSGNLFDSRESPEEPSQGSISEEKVETAEILTSPEPPSVSLENEINRESRIPPAEDNITEEEKAKAPSTKSTRRIVQLMVIYDDDTFKTFMPEN
jgi:hypothetical protein